MSESGKAVFLSYASQDAEAAKRIAEALRAAGVEVWFDKDELVGGDQWDAKIRGQIKECALFVPIISQATQARREAYFRLEWKLADDRTHLMARGTPFLLPVTIDGTSEYGALVPDSFLAAQWTALPGGETPPVFVSRVQRLLAGEPVAFTNRPPVSAAPFNAAPSASAPAANARPRWFMPVIAVVVVAAIALAIAQPWRSPEAGATPSTGATPAAAAGAWPRDAELRRAIALIDGLDATRDDFRLAEAIAQEAVEKAPADPEAVTALARVHSAYLARNFDFRPERTAQAKRMGERAVQLAPDNPEALYALSIVLRDRTGDYGRAEELARRACDLAPDNPRFARQLMRVVTTIKLEEGLRLGEANVARFPKDALTHYELSILYRDQGRWEDCERELDATIALAPTMANAINWKARLAMGRGDLPAMKTLIEQVPPRLRTEERSVLNSAIYALLSADYDYGIAALRGFGESWFFDTFSYNGPAALLHAELLAQQGKTALAREQYELARIEWQRHLEEYPGDRVSRMAESWIHLGLGRPEEARAALPAAIEALRRPYHLSQLSAWWFEPIPACLLTGDRATALQLLRETAEAPEGRATVRRRFLADPRLAAWHQDPEIVALLADPVEKK
jgi:tetratricopeptide (TPR) repeat protein